MSDIGPMPGLDYRPAPCPTCGAVNEIDAETKCRPTQDQTGEYSCAGIFDEKGMSVEPTPDSLKRLDDWCIADMERMEATPCP